MSTQNQNTPAAAQSQLTSQNLTNHDGRNMSPAPPSSVSMQRWLADTSDTRVYRRTNGAANNSDQLGQSNEVAAAIAAFERAMGGGET